MIFNYSSFMDNVFYRTKFFLHWRRNRGAKGGQAPPLGKKGCQHPICPPFHGSPLSALPSVYQFISCQYCIGLSSLCVRGHFRVLENEKISTLCEGENRSHRLPNSFAPLPRMCGPPLLNMLLRICILNLHKGTLSNTLIKM